MARPDVVVTGLFAPLVVLPLIALALIAAFRPPVELERGLLLIAACPIGGISATYASYARASVALSITLSAVSSVLAVATIPAIAAALEALLGRELGFVPPVDVLFWQLALMLATPVVFGMWLRRRFPIQADRWRPLAQLVGFAGIAGVLALVSLQHAGSLARLVPAAVPLALSFTAAAALAGWLLGVLTRASVPDRFTLAAEFATRNVAVAVPIAVTFLGQVEFVVFGAIYFLSELVLLVSAAAAFRSRRG